MNDGSPGWTFNGDLKKPTFKPSLLNRGGDKEGKAICHLYVTAGKIQYLPDCTHALAGKTVDMEDA